MGIFRSKAKQHSDEAVVETPQSQSYDIPVPPNYRNNESTHSSSYNTGSNISSADTRINQQQHQPVQPPKTTVITTTTTTTTTTTINGDGSVQTQTHPYDAAADPPPATETTVQSNSSSTQPSSEEIISQTPITDTSPDCSQVRRNSTSGGRPIPPRSELRNSMNPPIPLNTNRTTPAPAPAPTPIQPGQNEYEPSPLSLNPTGTPQSPTRTQFYPPPPTTENNYDAYQNTNQIPLSPNPNSAPQPHYSRREGSLSAAKGLHGAGEALRGSINGTIAKQMGDDADLIHQRAIREKGLREVRENRFPDRVSVGSGGNRLRKRSLSRGLTARDGQLERVDERSNF